jgi:hypothetical protein
MLRRGRAAAVGAAIVVAAALLFGPWYGLAPDDSPLILRDAATQEIYALDLELP